MNDNEILMWLHERLVHVYKESQVTDYMHKFRAIIASYPKDKITPQDGRGKNSIEELREALLLETKPKQFCSCPSDATININILLCCRCGLQVK